MYFISCLQDYLITAVQDAIRREELKAHTLGISLHYPDVVMIYMYFMFILAIYDASFLAENMKIFKHI